MELGSLLLLLVFLACPLMMVWMMRGHRGHGSHGGGRHGDMHGAHSSGSDAASLHELRRRRAELDDEIAQIERSETEPKAGVAS
jgi:hypothetical protein